jgi:hypothetical protein
MGPRRTEDQIKWERNAYASASRQASSSTCSAAAPKAGRQCVKQFRSATAHVPVYLFTPDALAGSTIQVSIRNRIFKPSVLTRGRGRGFRELCGPL